MGKRDRIVQLLRECILEYGDLDPSFDLQEETSLIGLDSPVDSISLAMIITGFEARLNEAFQAELVLTNEKAMSMPNSPFRSLGRLADYGMEMLDKTIAAV